MAWPHTVGRSRSRQSLRGSYTVVVYIRQKDYEVYRETTATAIEPVTSISSVELELELELVLLLVLALVELSCCFVIG